MTDDTPSTADAVVIFVPGVPIPQGSKQLLRRGGKVWMTDDNVNVLKPWRALVANHADVGLLFEGPVSVEYEFVFPRPKRPKFALHAVKPDLDKLARAIGDGLTDSGLIVDDSRIFDARMVKRYAAPDEEPGVHVKVTPR